jgi:RsiW-degrading membrane proteinase PrsW (M82 family)
VNLLLRIFLGLLPVFAFLGAMIVLDSFKLVRPRALLYALAVGAIAALISFAANSAIAELTGVSHAPFSRYIAPVTEELLKAAYLFYLLRRNRVGFLVDTAIIGFAIGAGFAFTENLYYLRLVPHAPLLTWVVRGFGTAIMHGGTTAIFGLATRALADRYDTKRIMVSLPGLLMAIVIHSLFNHFVLPPLISTAVILVLLPAMVALAFYESERTTQDWLGAGIDSDVEMLELIVSGQVSNSHIGRYLENLRGRFAGEVVVDMLCYLRLYLELALQAKGSMLLRQAGLSCSTDPELTDKFAELRQLESNIGATGKLAIMPFMRRSSRDLWQIYMLSCEKPTSKAKA